MPIILQPVDQIAHAELAQRLACWAKTEDGLTDRALIYQSCCVSPTGQTLGRWVVPEDLCAVYGPFNFTGNEGEVIPCPSVGSAEYRNYYIYDDDVHAIDPNTCVEVILAAPLGLNSPTQGPTTVDLAWDAVVGADTYIVRWSLAGQDDWTELPPTALLTAEVTGLDDETSYDFQVQAKAVGAVDSPWSATLTQATTSLGTLAAPTGLTSPSQSDTTMDVAWNPTDNATGYTVEWSLAGMGTWTTATNADTTYTITGLLEATSYDVRVKATAPDWTDSPYSATLTESTLTQLAAPGPLTVQSETDNSVDFAWDPVTDATMYVIRWSLAGAGVWTEQAPNASVDQNVTGLAPDTSYDFQVKSQAPGFADSDWSATETVSTMLSLEAPSNFAAGIPTATTMPLTWDSPVNAETYTVAWSPAGAGTWTSIAPTGNTTDTVVGLTPGTSYDFRVKSGATGWNDSPWSAVITAPTALAAPTGLDTTDGLLSTSILMQWNAVTGADEYVMRWSPAGAGTWTELAPTADTNDTATGLTPETSYDLQVKATATGFTDSAWSATHTASTTAVPQLAAPTGMASPAQTDTTVDLTWTAIIGADTYVVRHSPAGAGTWTEEAAVATNADTVASLTAATSYDFQVKAQGTGWIDSNWSTTFTQSTTA